MVHNAKMEVSPKLRRRGMASRGSQRSCLGMLVCLRFPKEENQEETDPPLCDPPMNGDIQSKQKS